MDVDRKESKSVSEVGQTIRRLTHLIYTCTSSPGEVRETIAKDSMTPLQILKCRFSFTSNTFRPPNLNKAIRLAVELETYNRLEKQILIQILEVFLRVSSAEDVTPILKSEASETKMNEVH